MNLQRTTNWIVAALVALGTTAAIAAVGLTERSTKTRGATTVTWDSSFHDLDYTLDNTVSFTVNWDVDAGAAAYAGFTLRRVTPKSKKDPATGSMGTVSFNGENQNGGSVTVDFTFTGLHLDRLRNVEIGNAHLKLYLTVDQDGDDVPDSLVGYGVNLHVEDPQ